MGQIASLFGIALKAIYGVIGNYGLSIIVFTIIVKMILMPLTVKQTKSTFAMSEINPKVKEIQAKYKNKPEKQNEEISKLYKESGINPLSGCLPILIQMPILMGLFYVFKDPVTHGVFASKAAMAAANGNFLWIKALSKPDYILAVFSGVSAYLMQKVMTPKDQIEGPMKMMSWLLAGMSLYWGVSSIFSVFQYYLITRPLKSKLEQEKADKEAGKSSFKKK